MCYKPPETDIYRKYEHGHVEHEGHVVNENRRLDLKQKEMCFAFIWILFMTGSTFSGRHTHLSQICTILGLGTSSFKKKIESLCIRH